MPTRRRVLAASASVLFLGLAQGPVAVAEPTEGSLAAGVAVRWQRTAARTIFVERGNPPPLGGLYLAFTSLAVYDAAQRGQRYGSHAAAAAVARAAHDVLLEYFPLSHTALDADLVASLAMVPDGSKKDTGVAIGAAAAAGLIASRLDDGRNDPQYVYTRTAALGTWPAAAVPGGMVLPWLGFVDPVLGVPPVDVAGPDPITTPAYAADFEEVRRLGATAVTDRTTEQTAIAQFFGGNPVLTYRNALCDLMDAEPLGLLPTARLFARIDAAVANSFIQTWRLKYEVGFWRPFQAIAAAAIDGNPGTNPHPVPWASLVTTPAYSEYSSGHAAATSPFAEVLRRTLGDDTPLVLASGGVTRSYTSLSALEFDAFHARIWGGLHFRRAMEDGYQLGHTTAERVISALR
jgi:hypothetical protein